MAKFQSFNVAPGADPMGIGVPDYGRSSFDPVEFVRRTWDEAQAKKMMRDEGARQKYQSMLEGLPTPEAFEQATAQALNKEGSEISNSLYKAYQEGGFDPLKASPETDKEISDLNRQMSEYKNKIDLYKFAKENYTKEWNRSRDLGKQGKIDEELTQQNFKKFMDEPDIYKKMAMLTENPLTVMRPEPVDLMKAMREGLTTFMPDLDKDITLTDFDENGMLKRTTIEHMDPKKAEKAMGQIWEFFPEEVRNELTRKYEKSPQSQKTASEDGAEIPVSPKDWFIAQYVPEFAKKMNVGFTKKPGEAQFTFNWNNVLPQKNKQTGQYDLTGLKGVRKYVTENTPSGTQELNYNAEVVMPLNMLGVQDMVIANTANTINTSTGAKEDASLGTRNVPFEVTIFPIATKDIEFVDKNGKKWSLETGEIIPADIQKQMNEINKQSQIPKYPYKHKAFLNSQTYYKQTTETGEMARVMKDFGRLPDDTASYIVTTTRPWDEAKNAVKAAAMDRKIDLQPLMDWISNTENQLNADYNDIFKDKTPKEYNDIFK